MSRRNTAWLDDPRCRHMRKPPAWYEDSEPIFISGPSLNMEKIAYEERERLWHQSASASFYEESENSCLTDTFCTCVSYSRTSQRLRLALSGKDATTVPEQPWFSPDCMQYCLCLPFYGCLVAKLQTTVRAFYDIDGSDESDWYQGCCCPGPTIARNDFEIKTRELEHKRIRQAHRAGQDSLRPYTTQESMSYMNSPSSLEPTPPTAPEASEQSIPTEEIMHFDKSPLNTIIETNRELLGGEPEPDALQHGHRAVTDIITPPEVKAKSPEEKPEEQEIPPAEEEDEEEEQEGQGQAQTPDESSKPEGLPTIFEGEGVDAEQPSPTGRWPLLQYLGQKWFLVPAGKENGKLDSAEGKDDATTAKSKPRATRATARHSISQDAPLSKAVSEVDEDGSHDMDDDPPLVMTTNRAARGHTLKESRPPLAEQAVNTAHVLGVDAAIASPPPVPGHYIDDDETEATVSKPAVGAHGLEDDIANYWQEPKLIAKHRLESHEATARGPSPVVGHHLREDSHYADAQPSLEHALESHEFSSAGAKSKLHNLSDEGR